MTRNSNRGNTGIRRNERRISDEGRQPSYNNWDREDYSGRGREEWDEDDYEDHYGGYNQRAAYGRDRDDDIYDDEGYERGDDYGDDDYGYDSGSAYGSSRQDFGHRSSQNTDYGSRYVQDLGSEQRRHNHELRESIRTRGLHPDERGGSGYWDSDPDYRYRPSTSRDRGRTEDYYRDRVAGEGSRSGGQDRGYDRRRDEDRRGESGSRDARRDSYNDDRDRRRNANTNYGRDRRYTEGLERQGQRQNSSWNSNYNAPGGRDSQSKRRGFGSQRNDKGGR